MLSNEYAMPFLSSLRIYFTATVAKDSVRAAEIAG
jgi:hypothetical protein